MENLETILNEAQLSAVQCTEGPLLVLAGAGSGKTRVLTYRIAYLIENRGIDPWNILAITFTNKAAGEMRQRVDQLVGWGSQYVWVSTFHSMCVRILRRYITEIGYGRDFSIYDTDDQRTVMKQIFKDLNIDPKQYKERSFLSTISREKNNGVNSAAYRIKVSSNQEKLKIALCYEEYEKRLKKNNALDFDDLLLKTVELFEKSEEALSYYQNRFHYILVDEYQDTNDIQFRLIQLLCGKNQNICVVGDDDQSIYRFRGANIKNILSFEMVFPEAKVVKLEQNYRSTKPILDLANAVIRINSARKEKRLWTDRSGGNEVHFFEYQTAGEEAFSIIHMVKSCGKSYQDQAVLYRTNAQSRLLEEQCIKMNVPYQIVGGVNFYQRREIKDILAYMKLLVNPSDDVSFERIINVPKRGIGPGTIQKLRDISEGGIMTYLEEKIEFTDELKGAGITGKALNKLREFVSLVRDWKTKLSESGLWEESWAEPEARTESGIDSESGTESGLDFNIASLIAAIRDDTGYSKVLEAEGKVEAETRKSNIEELISKAASYEESTEDPSFQDFLAEVSLLSDLDRKADDKNLLTLMTLHGSKGLEFPRVYLAGLSQGIFPGFQARDSAEDMEEERRLCYVGITRAKEELILTSARSRMMNGERQELPPSIFIRQIPDNLIDKHFLEDEMDEDSKFYDDDDDDYDYDYGGAYRRAHGRFGGYRGTGATRFKDSSTISVSKGRGISKDTINSQASKAWPYHEQKSGIPIEYIKKGSDILKAESLQYKVGDRVHHVKFGDGTVKDIEEQKRDYKVTIDFDKAGIIKMMAAYAKLETV